MMLLIWLMHFDSRWTFRKQLPFFDYYWGLLCIGKIIQMLASIDQYRNIILVIQAALAIKLQVAIYRMKSEKNLKQYQAQPEIIELLSNQIHKKLLLSQTGKISFIVSLLDLYWVNQEICTYVATLSIIVILSGFIIIKGYTIILSWAFPSFYISIKRKQL